MKPENQALGIMVLGVAVVVSVAAVGLYYLTPPLAPPASFPVPAGTVFTGSSLVTWTILFNVSGSGQRVVGSWSAFDGRGVPMLVVENGTLAGPFFTLCPRTLGPPFAQLNGTLDVSVGPGPHTLHWGGCFQVSRILVTGPIRLGSSLFA